MRIRINPEYVMPIAALMLTGVFITACAIQLSRDEAGEAEFSPISQEADPFAAKLARCRTVTPDQPAELEDCRRIWAENRRRFLTSTKPDWNANDQTRSEPSMKNQDRILPPEINRGPSGVR